MKCFCIRCTVNYIIGFTLNIYDSCIFHIDKRIRITECNITFNGNIHRLCRIDHDFTSIRPRLDLVIAAFGDDLTFKRDRLRLRYLPAQLRHFQAYPPQSKCIDRRTDVIMHAASTALMNRIFCFFILKTSAFC